MTVWGCGKVERAAERAPLYRVRATRGLCSTGPARSDGTAPQVSGDIPDTRRADGNATLRATSAHAHVDRRTREGGCPATLVLAPYMTLGFARQSGLLSSLRIAPPTVVQIERAQWYAAAIHRHCAGGGTAAAGVFSSPASRNGCTARSIRSSFCCAKVRAPSPLPRRGRLR
jgi:hypothetical protein